MTSYQIIIDVNDLQKPNIFGYDVFAFELDKTDTLRPMPYSDAEKNIAIQSHKMRATAGLAVTMQ